jgi:hypothetical protein
MCKLTLVLACLGAVQTGLFAQSFAPSTGSYWKRNPAPPIPLVGSQGNPAEAKKKWDDATRKYNDAAAAAQKKAADYAKTASDSKKAQAEAANAKQLVSGKTEALTFAQDTLKLNQSELENLKQQRQAITPAQKKTKEYGARITGLNFALVDREGSVTAAETAVKEAQAEVDQATRDATTKSAEAESAIKAENDAEAAYRDAERDVENKSVDVEAAKEQVNNPPIEIPSSEGGFGFSDLINVHIPQDGAPKFSARIHKSGDTDSTNDFKVEHDCPPLMTDHKCLLMVGFRPSGKVAETVNLVYWTKDEGEGKEYKERTVQITGTVGETGEGDPTPDPKYFLPLNRSPNTPEDIYETLPPEGKQKRRLEYRLQRDFGVMRDVSNAFWAQEKTLSYLSQAQYFYNTGSGSGTLSADFASMVFPGGTQVALALNTSVGTDNSTPPQNPATPAIFKGAATTSSAPPKMSSAQAAQAAQNLVDGGNVLLRGSWPLIMFAPKYQNLSIYSFVVGREGIDIPNFSGANTVANNPINHFNISNEWYAQVLAWPADKSEESAGSIFVDAKYGFEKVSSEFAKQAGFKNNWDHGFLWQVTGGLTFAHKINIVASRNFGPDQTWTDSTSGAATTQNNFAQWSVGVKYDTKQSK